MSAPDASGAVLDVGPVRTALDRQLGEQGRQWLAESAARIAADAAAIRARFPAAGRRCGREPLADMPPWTVDDAARVLLLDALPLTGPDLATEVAELYRYGDAAEKRGVLRGLGYLPGIGESVLPLVRDALRTNDTRLVAAALGPYGARHLDAPAYRQGVLKCVFMQVSLDQVCGLDSRCDNELVRMMRDYAAERVAAGRDVPADVWRIVPKED